MAEDLKKVYPRYFAKIRYLGSDFSGYQVQPGKRTVQGELCAALSRVLGGNIKVTGCSRTDAGVHAEAFAIVIDSPEATVPPEKLPIAVAEFLPQDICLYEAKECDPDFHPRYDVHSKEYRYLLLNSRVCDPFLVGRAWFNPRTIGDRELDRMKRACAYFLGEHDYSSFMAADSDTEDTVRRVDSFTVEKHGDLVEFRVRANGFLYHMVRIMVGTLVEIAFGRFEPEDIPGMLAKKDRSAAGMTAPAEGLYLHEVFY